MYLHGENKLHFCPCILLFPVIWFSISPFCPSKPHSQLSSGHLWANLAAVSWSNWVLQCSWSTVQRSTHIRGRLKSKVNGERVQSVEGRNCVRVGEYSETWLCMIVIAVSQALHTLNILTYLHSLYYGDWEWLCSFACMHVWGFYTFFLFALQRIWIL